MPTRITVRYLGSEVGKKVARPDTKGELLELAAKRLNLSTPALRVFATDARLGRLREAASPAPSQHRAARPPLRAACMYCTIRVGAADGRGTSTTQGTCVRRRIFFCLSLST